VTSQAYHETGKFNGAKKSRGLKQGFLQKVTHTFDRRNRAETRTGNKKEERGPGKMMEEDFWREFVLQTHKVVGEG